ncbi:major facilitator superfamily domain-containing protein [Stachybotrys elegans]|uniref:Major facilitator superfamily domain-containing protein n=1 Tax=Stachybotrys elegans TaxID=80388 RepID=A0A8K0SNR0_9HYPO|nr:major facilitator superfamily domain-containing protein [Stachybotrys elegans]
MPSESVLGEPSGANGNSPEIDETSRLLPPSTDHDVEHEGPRIKLSRFRGIALGISLWIMILTQTINFSGMSMIQGFIARELEADFSPMWLSTSFFIPVSALSPFVGRLATIFPARSLLVPTATLTALGSLVSAFAPSAHAFMVGRAVSGAGSAGILPLVVVLVLEVTTEKSRGIFVGMINAGATVGVAMGAFLYGALVEPLGWRPLFWIQSPVILAAGVGAYLSLPAPSKPRDYKSTAVRDKLKQIDYLGAALLVTTIVLFLYGLADVIEVIPLLLALVSLVAFILIETRFATDPIIPLNVLLSPGVLLTCFSQLGVMSARWSLLFYSPIFMSAVRGAALSTAGAVLIPTNVGFGIGGVIVGWLHVRRSGAFWLPSIVALAIFAASLALVAMVATVEAPIWCFVALLFANGFSIGAGLNYTLAHLLHLTSGRDAQYVATSLLATFRMFAGSFGTAIGGGVFYRLLRALLTQGFLDLDGTEELSPARKKLIAKLLVSHLYGDSSEEVHQVTVQAYAGAARGLWHAAAILALIMTILQAMTGWKGPEQEDANREEEEEARLNAAEHDTVPEA